MHTRIRRGVLIFFWSIMLLAFLAIVYIFFIKEPSIKIFPLIVFAIFGLTLYATLNLQTTVLMINDEGIIRKKFFDAKGCTGMKLIEYL
ncbi:MAG: hypothetical protein KAX49_16115 [Halanaerobiales bacterium]|nr:hypothetical protein [Halanaerobiales bacterium]